MTGATVRQLQLAIIATGLYLNGGADGTFGAFSTTASSEFTCTGAAEPSIGTLKVSVAETDRPAILYGAEFELQKHFDLSGLGGDESFFAGRRFVVIGNYTFTKSKLKVGPGDTTAVFGASSSIASDYFRDGAPLTDEIRAQLQTAGIKLEDAAVRRLVEEALRHVRADESGTAGDNYLHNVLDGAATSKTYNNIGGRMLPLSRAASCRSRS